MDTARHIFSITYTLLALTGASLVIYMFTKGKNRDSDMLRARAFLNRSFIKEIWLLLLFANVFLLIHSVMEISEIYGLIIETEVRETMIEIVEVGIGACLALSAYKWYRVIGSKRILFDKQTKAQEHLYKKDI